MRRFVGLGILALMPFVGVLVLRAQPSQNPVYAQPTPPGQPAWAYAIAPPSPQGQGITPEEDAKVYTLSGSGKSFTRAEIRNPFGPADWYPNDHPPMPDIVAKGRRPEPRACGLCHMPNGKGRSENASVSGLPVAYFIQTMNDFRSDLRKSSEPRKANAIAMVNIAKAMTEQEIKEAAEYFAQIKWTTPYIRVVETNTVPTTRVQGGIHRVLEGAEAGTEPIGQRIIEAPEHFEHFEILRDPHDGFVAYVPVGSIKKGEALVKTGGNGKTVACGVCHGPDLLGVGPVPPIAGRSPSLMVRQMWDMKMGTRKGLWSELMKPVIDKLTAEDMLNIVAYTASLPVVRRATD